LNATGNDGIPIRFLNESIGIECAVFHSSAVSLHRQGEDNQSAKNDQQAKQVIEILPASLTGCGGVGSTFQLSTPANRDELEDYQLIPARGMKAGRQRRRPSQRHRIRDRGGVFAAGSLSTEIQPDMSIERLSVPCHRAWPSAGIVAPWRCRARIGAVESSCAPPTREQRPRSPLRR
jgi:hypothetical protein